jgi:hypothetical protein
MEELSTVVKGVIEEDKALLERMGVWWVWGKHSLTALWMVEWRSQLVVAGNSPLHPFETS